MEKPLGLKSLSNHLNIHIFKFCWKYTKEYGFIYFLTGLINFKLSV